MLWILIWLSALIVLLTSYSIEMLFGFLVISALVFWQLTQHAHNSG